VQPIVFNRNQIEEALKDLDPIQAVEEGFIAYSEGRVVVPPVGELMFEDPPGDMQSSVRVFRVGCSSNI
jgi:ornithine cyclodeaminase